MKQLLEVYGISYRFHTLEHPHWEAWYIQYEGAIGIYVNL